MRSQEKKNGERRQNERTLRVDSSGKWEKGYEKFRKRKKVERGESTKRGNLPGKGRYFRKKDLSSRCSSQKDGRLSKKRRDQKVKRKSARCWKMGSIKDSAKSRGEGLSPGSERKKSQGGKRSLKGKREVGKPGGADLGSITVSREDK